MKFPKKTIAAFGLLAASAIGCNNYEAICEKKLQDEGFTQEQAEVLTAVSYRNLFTDELKDPNGTATYNLNYGAITEEDIFRTVKKTHNDLEQALDPDQLNMLDLKYYLNTGIGKHVLKQEQVYKYLEDTLSKKVLHSKFKEMMREKQDFSYYNPYKIKEDDKYSIATTFPFKEDKIEFEAKYVKIARSQGKFKDPSTVVEEVTDVEKFYEKVKNPKYPVLDKNEKFIYKERKMGLKMISYNLDDDKEKTPDYIEAYRLKENGKSETMPSIRVFKPNGSGDLEIVLADADFEGEKGYGIPDYLQQARNIESANDLYASDVIDYIFKDMKKNKDMPNFNEELNKIYIVKTGETSVEKYEINPEGWESYLPDYKSAKKHQFSSKFISYIKSKNKPSDEKDGISDIEWIAKSYNDKSRAVEFYRINEKFKKDYTFPKYLGSSKTIELMDKEGQVHEYALDVVIEKIPFRIDFDRNAEKRWEIIDKDNDKKHYEAKKEVSTSSEIIPK